VTPEGDQVDDDPRYKLLAGAFASFLASSAGPAGVQRGEPIGRLLGRTLARNDGTRAIASSKAARRVNDLLTDMGFESELHITRKSYRLLLHHCPFNDLAVEHQDVICGFHLGLVKQVLEQTNTAAMTVSLQPFVTPKLCIAELVKPGAETP
jgi:predicted ArsR family transcriptional regulator